MHNTVYTIGNNKDLLHSTGNYTLYLIIEENLKKNICICFPGDPDGKSICLKFRRTRFYPWVGKIPWRIHGNPLQYSCLENSIDRA